MFCQGFIKGFLTFIRELLDLFGNFAEMP